MNKAKHFDTKASTRVVEHINGGGGVFYSKREEILRKHPQLFMKCRRLQGKGDDVSLQQTLKTRFKSFAVS